MVSERIGADGTVRTREIAESDLPTCVAIYNDAANELHRSFGFEEDVTDDDSWLLTPLRHLLRTDPSGGRIASDDDGDIAFASTLVRDRFWFLAFLFVRPWAQGRGRGRTLLRELLPEDAQTTRATVVESFQAVATGLYASVGMFACAVKYSLTGPGRELSRFSETRLARSDMTASDLEDIGRLDERLLGFRRLEDHRWWMDSMTGFTYREGGDLVGYAYVDGGYISPALAVDERMLCRVLADAADAAEITEVETGIWVSSRELFRMLISTGFRIKTSRYSLIYASSAGALPASYIAHSDWLP